MLILRFAILFGPHIIILYYVFASHYWHKGQQFEMWAWYPRSISASGLQTSSKSKFSCSFCWTVQIFWILGSILVASAGLIMDGMLMAESICSPIEYPTLNLWPCSLVPFPGEFMNKMALISWGLRQVGFFLFIVELFHIWCLNYVKKRHQFLCQEHCAHCIFEDITRDVAIFLSQATILIRPEGEHTHQESAHGIAALTVLHVAWNFVSTRFAHLNLWVTPTSTQIHRSMRSEEEHVKFVFSVVAR